MPAKPVSRLKSGRARSTRYLIPFDRANWPPTTKVRKKTTARGCPRRASTMQAMIARRMTPRVPPNSLTWRMKSLDADVACSAPKRAKRTSSESTPNFVRIMASRTPMPTAPKATIAVAVIRATPVSVFGLKWWRRWPASPGWRVTSLAIVLADTCGSCALGQRDASSATAPPTTTPAPMVSRMITGDDYPMCRGVCVVA